MASEYKGLTVKFEGDSTKLTAALGEINKASRKAQSQLRQMQNAAKIDPSNIKAFRGAVEAARDKVEATTKRVEALRQAQQQLAASGDTTSEAYKRVNRELVLAETYLKRDQRALVEATNAASAFGRASVHIEKFAEKAKSASTKMQAVGSTLTRHVSLPLAAAAAASFKSAVDIDTALTGVRKTVDMTEEGYQNLKRGAVELSRTQPVSANTILNMEALGAQLGWSNDKLQDFAMTVAGLDIATDMDAETAATELAQFANITRMAQGDAGRYASSIVALGNNMATTESKISAMSQGMASAGTQAGMSQADILGVAAAAASLGLEAQAGGSAFSKTINEIGMAVSTNGKTLQTWADVAGMSVEQFKAAWQTDVTGTFERVIEGLGKVKANGGDLNETLAELGVTELRQSDFLRRMAGNSDLVSRAVELSNGAWKENTALGKEVENRNKSLAAKIDVLKNRVTALATEVGGSLADAAMAALEAAEPLFKSVEKGAKAFAEMDKESQQTILKLAAFATAAGPVISIAGKITGAGGTIAKGVAKSVKGLGNFVNAARATDEATKAAFSSAGGLSGKLGALAGSAGLAGGAVALVGVALVGMTGAAIANAVRLEHRFDGIKGAIKSFDAEVGRSGALAHFSQELDDVGTHSTIAKYSLDDLAGSLSKHGAAIRENNDAAEGTIAQLNTLQNVIGDSIGKTNLSAEENGKLEWALKTLSDQYGINISKSDVLAGKYTDENGQVQDLKSNIDSLVEAKKKEARINAASKNLTEAYSAQIDAVKAYQSAVKDLNEEYQKSYKHFYDTATDSQLKMAGQSREEFAAHAAKASHTYNELKGNVDEAKKSLEDMNGQVKYLEAQMGDAASGALEFGDAIAALGSKAIESATNAGLDITKLSESLQAAGVSVEQVSALGTDMFSALATASKGSVDDMVTSIQNLNALGIDPKEFTVTDDGTIKDQAGNVWDFDAMTINGKHYTVNSDGTITAEELGIDHLEAKKITDKRFVVEAEDHATTTISHVIGMLSQVSGVFTAHLHANASGGIVGHAAGGIRMHADGGAIYNRPTFISPHDVIGENGSEYYDGTHIIPLTNKQHSQPFVDLIADGVVSRMGNLQHTEIKYVTINQDVHLGASDPSVTARTMGRDLAAVI